MSMGMATQKQIDYIEILCNDVGFDTRVKRNDFISNLLGYKVKFLDELALVEASRVIEELKLYKENNYDPRDDEFSDNEYNPLEDYRK